MKAKIKLSILLVILSLVLGSPVQDSCVYRSYLPLAPIDRYIPLGSATHHTFLLDAKYAQTLIDYFDILVPEVAGNYYYIAENGWGSLDAIFAFAIENSVEVHYHTILWYWSPIQPPDPLAWISEAMSRYNLANYIIVNEGYTADGLPTIPGIEEAYAYARIVKPGAILWYNGILTGAGEQEQVKRLVEARLVDAVGVQCHLNVYSDLSVYDSFLSWLNENGIPWRISELDVSIYSYTDDYLAMQAAKYAEAVAMLNRYGGESITLWEFTDKYHWLMIPVAFYASPFDLAIEPKPAWNVLVER